MDKIRLLFEDYCYYRQYTIHLQRIKAANPYLKPLKPTEKRLKLFGQLIKWCKEYNVDPQEWVYTLFVSRRWMYAPRLEPNHLMSLKHLNKHRGVVDYKLFKKRRHEQRMLKDPFGDTFDPNRDISHKSEDIKQSYVRVGRADLCMDNMSTQTFGYHPKSGVCTNCSVSEVCKRRLVASVSFDVMALRRGEITSGEARKQAIAGATGYGRQS